MLFCSCFTSTNILSFLLFLSIAATNTDRKTNLGFRDKPQRENKIVFAGNKHIGTWRTWCGYPSTMVPLFPSAKNRNSECQPATTTTPVNAKKLPRESDWVCELSVSLWLHLSAPSPGLHLGILTLQYDPPWLHTPSAPLGSVNLQSPLGLQQTIILIID